MPAVPFYTPGWREPQWSKVPCPLKEATRRDGRGLNPRPPYLLFEVLTARPHTVLVVYQFHLQVQKKGRYPTSNPLTQLFRFVSCPNYTYEVSLTKNIFLPDWFYLKTQWWILGKGLGRPPPLIFRPNWRPKGWKKVFWDRPPPPLSQGLDDRRPHLIWRSGPQLFKRCITLSTV